MNKMQFKIQIQSVEMFLMEEEIFKGEAKKKKKTEYRTNTI